MTRIWSRRGPRVGLLAVVSLLAVLVVPTAAVAEVDAGAESAFLAAVNRERAAAGLPGVQLAGDLVAVARRHSARMADADNLHHNPNLSSEVGGWQRLGENVGRGPSVDPIHAAFMESAAHRDNILDPGWTQAGIGVEVRGSTMWVTEVFRQPEGAAPAPEPEPEPEPEPAPEPAPAPEAEPAPEPQPATAQPVAAQAVPSSAAPAAAPSAEPTQQPAPATPQALPPVDPVMDRTLVMLTRAAAADALLDATR